MGDRIQTLFPKIFREYMFSKLPNCHVQKNGFRKSPIDIIWLIVFEKEGLVYLRKVSTHVSLCNPRRLTWAETFRCVFKFSASHRTILSYDSQSPIAQSVALRTWEQEYAGSIPGSASIPFED